MMDTSTLFLGTIALSVLVMATVQVGMIIYGARLAQRPGTSPRLRRPLRRT